MILYKNDILITGAASRSPTNKFLILCADRSINKNLSFLYIHFITFLYSLQDCFGFEILLSFALIFRSSSFVK